MEFLEAEYGEDSTTFRDSAPIQTSISESDDSEYEGVQICTSPQESASDVDAEASRREPRELSTIYECDEEVGDDQCRIRQTALNNDNDPPTISST